MVKVPNLWEYLFLTCIAVGLALLDHRTSKLVSDVVGRERGGKLFPHLFRGDLGFSSKYDGIIVFKILSPAWAYIFVLWLILCYGHWSL